MLFYLSFAHFELVIVKPHQALGYLTPLGYLQREISTERRTYHQDTERYDVLSNCLDRAITQKEEE